MSTLYSSSTIDKLIHTYVEEFGGEAQTIEEGSLGHGTVLLSAQGRKYIIVQEKFINEWSSGHTVRMYNKLPKKYANN